MAAARRHRAYFLCQLAKREFTVAIVFSSCDANAQHQERSHCKKAWPDGWHGNVWINLEQPTVVLVAVRQIPFRRRERLPREQERELWFDNALAAR